MTKAAPGKNKVRTELNKLSEELRALKSRVDDSKSTTRDVKFCHYLEVLEDTHNNVSQQLSDLDGSDNDAAMNAVKRGLTEAKQRLAIAKKAAAARFV
jgi:hypothetical protein